MRANSFPLEIDEIASMLRRMMNRLTALLALVVLFSGCAGTPKTSSGMPEVLIENRGAQEIAEATVGLLTARGYTYRGTNSMGLVFERPLQQLGDEFYSSEGSPGILRLRIHLFRDEESDAFRLIGNGAVVTRIGAISDEIAPDRKGNSEIQKLLKEIRASLK